MYSSDTSSGPNSFLSCGFTVRVGCDIVCCSNAVGGVGVLRACEARERPLSLLTVESERVTYRKREYHHRREKLAVSNLLSSSSTREKMEEGDEEQ